ncbi:MAG: hypothetical protein CTY15_13260 [Methylocystis sp.]|nr:MAG: hypothetical protein CTY15_13260 [Methylocystis sp.]
MPGRWLTSILFALALAVQAFSPVASGVAAASGADGHGLSEICLKVGPDHDRHRTPGHHTHGHHESCVLCQAFCDGVAPVATRPVLVTGMAPVLWTEVQWTVADRALPAHGRDYARQARAPPIFS